LGSACSNEQLYIAPPHKCYLCRFCSSSSPTLPSHFPGPTPRRVLIIVVPHCPCTLSHVITSRCCSRRRRLHRRCLVIVFFVVVVVFLSLSSSSSSSYHTIILNLNLIIIPRCPRLLYSSRVLVGLVVFVVFVVVVVVVVPCPLFDC